MPAFEAAESAAGPRYALLLLRDDRGRVLLQLRDCNAPKFAHQWACFGGGVEPGESFEAAVAREAWEELRYRVRQPRRFAVLGAADYGVPIDPSVTGLRAYFVEDFDSSQTLELHEGADLGWFSLEDAQNLDSPAHHRELIRRLAAAEATGGLPEGEAEAAGTRPRLD